VEERELLRELADLRTPAEVDVHAQTGYTYQQGSIPNSATHSEAAVTPLLSFPSMPAGASHRALTKGKTKEPHMPKYLLQANYVGEGVKGLLKEGGTNRRAAAEQVIQSVGGRLESFYYAFGETDVFLVAEVPDHVSMAALALTINASGVVATKTTVLMTPEEVDAASKKTLSYRAPGR